jgi:hypothetical protein
MCGNGSRCRCHFDIRRQLDFLFSAAPYRGPQGFSVNVDRSTIKFPVLQRLTASGNEPAYANRTGGEKYHKASDSDGHKRNAAEASDLVEDRNLG